jgi:hypothetical protein
MLHVSCTYATPTLPGLQEYYLALSGPAASLPDLHSNTTLALFATALHTTLELPQSYPASNILTCLVLPAPTAAGPGRHLLLTGQQKAAIPTHHTRLSPVNHRNALVHQAAAARFSRSMRKLLQDSANSVNAVLGVKFPPGPGLPSDEVLDALLVRSSTMRDLAANLAAVSFVAVPEDVAVTLSDSKGYPKAFERQGKGSASCVLQVRAEIAMFVVCAGVCSAPLPRHDRSWYYQLLPWHSVADTATPEAPCCSCSLPPAWCGMMHVCGSVRAVSVYVLPLHAVSQGNA